MNKIKGAVSYDPRDGVPRWFLTLRCPNWKWIRTRGHTNILKDQWEYE